MEYLRYLIDRIRFANQGIRFFFLSERNGQIQLALAVAVIALGIHYDTSRADWGMLILCIGFVMTLEMINTALEVFCDHVRPEKHKDIQRVKDVAAGAVWWAAVTALIVGALVFYPYIIKK